jgi:hypothetical protein
MEERKMKISILWLLAAVAFLGHQMIVLMEPGILAQLLEGKAEGQQIGPGMLLSFALLMLAPLVMSFLSLTLKGSMNRWANTIVGVIFAALWFFSAVAAARSAYWGGALMTLAAAASSALIVWHSWRNPA